MNNKKELERVEKEKEKEKERVDKDKRVVDKARIEEEALALLASK